MKPPRNQAPPPKKRNPAPPPKQRNPLAPRVSKENLEAKEAASKAPKGNGVTFSTASKLLINSSMLPSERWYIEEGQVHFQQGMNITSFPKTLPDERAFKGRDIVFPMRTTLLVDSLMKATLPEPVQGGNPALLAHPWLCLKPQAKRCSHHSGGEQECFCFVQGMSGQYHRTVVLPDTCLKKDMLGPMEAAVAPKDLQLLENPARFYQWNEAAGDHLLGLPPPFLIGGRWPPIPYEPAMALTVPDNRVRLYYALYNAERFRQVASIYTRPPTEWSQAEHPTCGEPPAEGELGRITSSLYGLETLSRTGFCAHPCGEPRILLFCAVAKEDRAVPVFRTNMAMPLRVEAAVTEIIRPWYEGGQGMILCSVCLVHTSNSEPSQLMWLSRGDYIDHWEKEHVASMVASNIFSATQMHVRLHLGHLAYVLALAGVHNGEDNPRGTAVSCLAMERYGVLEHDDVLKNFLGPASNEEVADIMDDFAGPRDDAGPSTMDSMLEPNTPRVEQELDVQRPAGHFLAPKNNRRGR